MNSEARERVLQVAEKLFAERGYTAVTLKDIAAELGMRHASLYHHVPGGKEQLFIEVTERTLQRHHIGLEQAISESNLSIRDQLHAVATWLISQPPMDLIRMVRSDMPTINPTEAIRLSQLALDSMIVPIMNALHEAEKRGEVQHHHLGLVAGGILGLIESMHAVPEAGVKTNYGRLQMAHELIDVMLYGLLK